MKRFILLLAAVAFLFTVPLSTYSIAEAAYVTHHHRHYVKKHKKHVKRHHHKKHFKRHHHVKRYHVVR